MELQLRTVAVEALARVGTVEHSEGEVLIVTLIGLKWHSVGSRRRRVVWALGDLYVPLCGIQAELFL